MPSFPRQGKCKTQTCFRKKEPHGGGNWLRITGNLSVLWKILKTIFGEGTGAMTFWRAIKMKNGYLSRIGLESASTICGRWCVAPERKTTGAINLFLSKRSDEDFQEFSWRQKPLKMFRIQMHMKWPLMPVSFRRWSEHCLSDCNLQNNGSWGTQNKEGLNIPFWPVHGNSSMFRMSLPQIFGEKKRKKRKTVWGAQAAH